MKGDTFGWSPDIGSYVERGDHVYTVHGHVYPAGGMWRSSLSPSAETENYADWTDEKRAAVRVEAKARQAREEQERREEDERRARLIATSRAKLTDEEYEAVYTQGLIDGR